MSWVASGSVERQYWGCMLGQVAIPSREPYHGLFHVENHQALRRISAVPSPRNADGNPPAVRRDGREGINHAGRRLDRQRPIHHDDGLAACADQPYPLDCQTAAADPGFVMEVVDVPAVRRNRGVVAPSSSVSTCRVQRSSMSQTRYRYWGLWGFRRGPWPTGAGRIASSRS